MSKQNLLKRLGYLNDEAETGEKCFTDEGRNTTVKSLKIVVEHCSEEDVKKWLNEEGIELIVWDWLVRMEYMTFRMRIVS